MKHVLYCTALLVSAATANTAIAAPYVIASDANAASASLSVAGGAVQAIAAVGGTSGSGNVYNDTQTFASLNGSANLSSGTAGFDLLTVAAGLGTGVVHSRSSASTTTIFHGVPSSVTGTVDIANANLSLNSKLLALVPVAAIGLTADTIVSTSTAGYDPATHAYYTTGSSSITNLGLTGAVLGIAGLNVAIGVNPAPNTYILNTPSLKIIANEQISSVSADGASIVTNALHIILNGYQLNPGSPKLITGDFILGHSAASVPEPEAWAMMILGFGLIGGVLRSKRRQFAPAAPA